MDLLNRQDLQALIDQQATALLTIFVPTHRMGRETLQDQIRLKNLLGEARDKLKAAGLKTGEVNERLQPAERLLDDDHFWQHQLDGLVLFVGPDTFHAYRLPLAFDELVVVANRFHIKPLLPMLSMDNEFFVLALSQNKVRLLHGNRYNLDEIDLTEAPEGLSEAIKYDEILKQQQFHTKTAQTTGNRSAIFHGQGAGKDREISRLLDYLRQVDRSVSRALHGQQAPLIMAAVEYLVPLYREVNSYPNLFDTSISGNPDTARADELQQQAWELLEPHFKQTQQETLQEYQMLTNTAHSSSDLRKIVPAAYTGRVDTLFVSVDHQQWGAFDPHTNTIELHPEPQPGAKDLLDAAAVQTLLHNGTVYAVPPEKMPNSTPLAAIFRYA